ncbi:MAG: protoheme IX farnesyltransferase [Alphaproteobacteria bacterium]|nr:protoheme IX farnesyltransferase [Alphaproteobacteria bacterium]
MSAAPISGVTVTRGVAPQGWVGDASVGDYFALLKPRVMSLVVFTAVAGLVVAPGSIHPILGLVAILCIAVGAGASGALNMWYDADLDARMERTKNRPIPSGRVPRGDALVMGLGLSAGAVGVLGFAVDWTAAALLAFTIFFYAVIYTAWLKRRTPQNIVIGGAAGAFPPMIGWVAATHSIDLGAVILFLIIFLWTPPHFWALALLKSEEYAKNGIPMMPVVKGPARTKNEMMVYSVLVAIVGVAPWYIGLASIFYGIAAGLLGLAFLGLTFQVWRHDEPVWPKRLYGFSILYLILLFAFLLVEGGTQALAS